MTIPSSPDSPAVDARPTVRAFDVASAPTVFGPTEVDPVVLPLPGRGSTRLEVSVEASGPGTVVTVRGELLQETARAFVDAVADIAHDAAVEQVVVDLSGTAFMDSTGLGTLVTLRNHVIVRGGGFALIRPEDRVFRLFEITRLDSVFDFVDAA